MTEGLKQHLRERQYGNFRVSLFLNSLSTNYLLFRLRQLSVCGPMMLDVNCVCVYFCVFADMWRPEGNLRYCSPFKRGYYDVWLCMMCVGVGIHE